MILKLANFKGELPSLIPRALPDGFSQEALNVRLDDGGLTPFRAPMKAAYVPAPATKYKTIYRHKGVWRAWESDVWCAPGPVDSDRLYVFGDGAPKMIYGGATYPLAVPAPSAALTATLSGTATSELGSTRFYVRTFVTSLGEESQPSPASNELYWKPGQSVTLSGFSLPPDGRLITKERIYRAQTSLSGTQLYFIAERDVSTSNFTDTVSSTAINEPLPSLDWDPPVATLNGLISVPNGNMAAYSGKEVFFCEPWRPHAWPKKYALTCDFEIVGLGAYGNSIIVMTTGHPYIVSGTHPESMYMEKLELNYPCVSARGIEDLGYAVVYPSTDGLVLSSSGGPQLITSGILTREAWERLNPSSIHSGQRDGRYFCSYTKSDATVETIIIDATGQQPFIIRTDFKPDAMFHDITTGALFFIVWDTIYQFDPIGKPNMTYSWKSKEFIAPKPTNFGAILIDANTGLSKEEIALIEQQQQEDIAYNQSLFDSSIQVGEVAANDIDEFSLNGDNLRELQNISYVCSVNVYADDKLVANVNRVNEMARLPAGFLARKWVVQVNGDVRVMEITLAGTGFELSGA